MTKPQRREYSEAELRPAVWEADDQSDASQKALQYQSWLANSLERDFDEVILKAIRRKAMPPELIRAAIAGVQEATVVLWSSELFQGAVRNHSEFSDQVVEVEDLPNNPQLWLTFGGESAETMRLESEQFTVGARLVLPFPDQHLVVYLKLLHPFLGLSVDLHAVPTLALYGTLHTGERVARNKGGEMFSCLRYLDEIIEAERNLAPLTKAKREAERETPAETSIRTTVLRKKIFEPTTGSVRASRKDQFRYPVRSFVRKPSPLMRDPRPVLVKAHIRGPADKPLKGRTSNIYVVTR